MTDIQCLYKRNIKAHSCNHWCNGKAICITYYECAYSLSYPTCNAHEPYCHLWPAWLYNIFPHYLINGIIFKKKLLNTKCVFWFPLPVLSETFLILRRNEWDMIHSVYWSSCKVPIILIQFLIELEFSWQFCKKYSNINFHKNPSSASWVVPCGQTDGWTDKREEAQSRFSQFWEYA
jgi:hypothetical protein